MQAGKLRHRLEVQAPTAVKDALGGERQDWHTVETVWGSVDPGRSREFFEAKKLEGRITHEIHLRYGTQLQNTWRLKLKGTERIFNVYPPMNPDERNREVKLMAMEIV